MPQCPNAPMPQCPNAPMPLWAQGAGRPAHARASATTRGGQRAISSTVGSCHEIGGYASPLVASTAQREIPSNRCCPLCITHYFQSRPAAATLVSGPLARCREATVWWIVRLERLFLRRMPCIEQTPWTPSRPLPSDR
jgi:hypothetical protein